MQFKKFVLRREGVSFTEEKRRKIKETINEGRVRQKDLVSIECDEVGDNYVIVKVREKSVKWHSKLCYQLHQRVGMEGYWIPGKTLFHDSPETWEEKYTKEVLST